MKKISVISASVLFLLILLGFIITRPVDVTPFYETDYYKLSQYRIDSLRHSSGNSRDSFSAGFSKVSITPLINQSAEDIRYDKFEKIPLAGYGDRKGVPATGIHDSIYIKAAALETGKKLIVFISADLLIIPPDITDSVVSLMRGYGITRDRLYFAATHTHSGIGGWAGGFIGKQFAGEENENLKKWLALKISKAIIAAVEDLKPARISSGNFPAGEYTRNRLVGDKGTKNDDFSFFYIEQPGYKKAVIGSFSAHSTTLGDENMEISADYPGYWASYMEKTMVDHAMFLAGAMGSQSPISNGKGFESARYLGEALAEKLKSHIDPLKCTDNPYFSYAAIDMPLPDFRFRLTDKRTLSTFLSRKLMPIQGQAYIQAIRLGDMIWISTPADFSGEYALMIKNRLAVKGFKSNVTSFNGHYLGYIIPGRYFYMNKYEPRIMGWYGPAMGDYTMEIIRQLTDVVNDD